MNHTAAAPRRLVLIGAGGHAKVLLALAQAAGLEMIGVCDPGLAAEGNTTWRGLPVLGSDDSLREFSPDAVGLVNGVGQLVDSRRRAQVGERFRRLGFRFPALLHPTAWVTDSAQLAEGVQVMAGAIIQPDCKVGMDTIVNTRSSIDHDCSIGANVHIAPAATLCGGVVVADGVFVGAGATLLPLTRVGRGCVLGAGVTLTEDLADEQRIVGASPRLLHSGR